MTSTDPMPQQPPSSPVQAPPAWAWAAPTVLETRETEPLDYHRLYRGVASYRWWKPLLVLLLAAVFYFLLSIIPGGILIAWLTAEHGGAFTPDQLNAYLLPDTQNPISILVSLGTIVLMIPSVWFAMWCMGMRPRGRAWSVALKLRWGLIWRTLGLSVGAVVFINMLGIALEMLFALGSELPAEAVELPEIDVSAAMLSLLFIVLLVPLQATAEELVFRGLFMQVIGSWLRSPWLAIALPTVAFALMHIYDIWGMLVVGTMGLVAGWLVWRTGGLEAAISLHVVNNLFAFGFLTSGITGETGQTESSGGALGGVIAQAVGLVLYAWVVVIVFRRGGYGRQRIDLIQVPVPAPAVDPAYVAAEPLPASAPSLQAEPPAPPTDSPALPAPPAEPAESAESPAPSAPPNVDADPAPESDPENGEPRR